jgi:dihydroorotase
MPVIDLPGLIDAHVHLRDPGATHKEDWYTGTSAAIAGGVTVVLDMPNNSPPTADAPSLQSKHQVASSRAVCDYALFVGATPGNAEGVGKLPGAVGLKIYMNETYGPLRVDDLDSLMRQFQAWPADRPIAVHAEGISALLAIGLGQLYGKHVHLCHVSGSGELALVRRAKERGWRITCEVTPHHLFLTDHDAALLGSRAYMKPALGNYRDRNALWDNLDIVDLIATDHAPHTLSEKAGPQPPSGVPGLETMLPLLLTAVAEGRLTLPRLLDLTVSGPSRVYGLRPVPGSRVWVDTDSRFDIGEGLFTKCGWSPFVGWPVRGRVVRTVVRGTVAYEDNRVRVPAGFGQRVK